MMDANKNSQETKMQSKNQRFAVIEEESGMVVGDGATQEEAWADAKKETLPDRCTCTDYDTTEYVVKMAGGIVCLVKI